MKKLLLLFVTSLGAITISQAQQTISLSTNATSLNDIKISENGYILEQTSPGVYAQRTITLTSTNDPGDGSGGYNNAFFVVKNGVPTNVATAGTLSTANATTVSINADDPTINTRTWEISLLNLVSGNIPQGSEYDFRATGGSSIPPTTVEIVASYTIPVVEKHIYEFNSTGNTEGFSATNSAITVSAGKMIITTDAVTASAPHPIGFVRKSGENNYIDATTYKWVHIYYRNKSSNSQIRFITGTGGTNGTNFTPTVMNMTNESPYEVAVINLAGLTTWTGNISTFDIQHRVNNTTSLAGTLEIDRIEFSIGNTLGLKNNQVTQHVNVFPNPTNGAITISDLEDSKTIHIYNMLGAVVKSFPASNTIDISDLATGIYILKTDTGLSSKIVKQ
ncbi:T9SS type A sorting domain-containing protein [Flavobacterium sp. 7A]|uniref:T9SS type A sorting domain-containing protein n=1 Tax=Flavobacterium sp. 7A TaxID=2940571 RepID=UPI0022277DF9|nr:T9SS type A sorting domain-containing protein [Flavobacterium sp. 7A]MCW2120623.1 hypothetical protein [Flavobacterium sp. 7A]